MGKLPAVLLVGIFLAALFLVPLVTFLGPAARRTVSATEKRTLAPLPAVPRDLPALTAFSGKFEAWFNDHFFSRDQLVTAHSYLQLELFGQSSNRQVVVGRAGWLYYDYGSDLDNYRGLSQLQPEFLQVLRETLEIRRDWFARRGVRYLFVVAPDKQTIYPDYLPAWVRKIHPDTALDQFMDYLHASGSTLEVPDLRPVLRAARATNRLYLRTDTHWNGLGAQVAHTIIQQRLANIFPEAHFPPPLAVTASVAIRPGGDLADLLGLSDILREHVVTLTPTDPHFHAAPWNLTGLDTWQTDFRHFVRDPGASLRVLVLRDSFYVQMLAPLAEQTAESLFLARLPQTHHDDPATLRSAIDQFHPDIVIEEIVERNLLDLFVVHPGGLCESNDRFLADP
ncbi:MAG: hypothetical protein JO295_04175 [Verrucomicrobia bacterium]|nr:hypothetical protein [Verrucomicrobiota bacterium]